MERIIIGVFLLLATSAQTTLAEDLPSIDRGAEFFVSLRIAYSGHSNFDPHWSADEERKAIVEAFKNRDYQSVVDLSASWLSNYPIDAETHLLRSIAFSKLGDYESALRHRAHYFGLISSLLSSGDGRTPETAIKVISIDEEYWLIGELRGKVVRQSLLQGDTTVLDVMEFESEGETRTLYFDVQIPMLAGQRIMDRQ